MFLYWIWTPLTSSVTFQKAIDLLKAFVTYIYIHTHTLKSQEQNPYRSGTSPIPVKIFCHPAFPISLSNLISLQALSQIKDVPDLWEESTRKCSKTQNGAKKVENMWCSRWDRYEKPTLTIVSRKSGTSPICEIHSEFPLSHINNWSLTSLCTKSKTISQIGDVPEFAMTFWVNNLP